LVDIMGLYIDKTLRLSNNTIVKCYDSVK